VRDIDDNTFRLGAAARDICENARIFSNTKLVSYQPSMFFQTEDGK